jgi:alpha-glucosidase
MHKSYSRLRARLVPYLYSWAYQSTRTGVPLLLPLTLEFQDEIACRDIRHEYLLGRDLLVVIYEREAYFPAGRWVDYWTGEMIDGAGKKAISWPQDRGGGLYVRSGGIITLGPLMQYRGERPVNEVELYLFPGSMESSTDFYEDDGISMRHHEGEFAITPISTWSTDSLAVVRVKATRGSFEGQVQDRTWSFTVALDFVPSYVEANGAVLPETAWQFDPERNEVRIEALLGPIELRIAKQYTRI